MPNAIDVVRSSVRDLLQDFVKRPMFNVRESDVQAELMLSIRRKLSVPTVTVEVVHNIDVNGAHHHGPSGTFVTSRVHMELKADPKTRGARTDVIVFKEAGPVRLTCYPAGALDIVAPIKPEDVEVVVEVKAAPSKAMWKTYCDDLLMLADLRQRYPHLHAVFVLLDKSLVLGGISSSAKHRADWLPTAKAVAAQGVESFYANTFGEIETVPVNVGRCEGDHDNEGSCPRRDSAAPKGESELV